jgi:hypothetical protein
MSAPETALPSIERKLARRYPGISCRVKRHTNDGYYGKGHGAWSVQFFARDRESLIEYGLATAEQFELHDTLSHCKRFRHPSSRDEFGDSTSAYPAIGPDGCSSMHIVIADCPDTRVYTKKLQGEVLRLLKPFIRGTWKAQAVRP